MFVPDDPDDLAQDPSDSSRSNPSTPPKDADPFQTADKLPSTDSSTTSSKTIGPYRLVRKLGEGGMGQVWLAEQTAPLQRLVAIKLIRAGVSDNVLLERFESKRQTLARINHPTISKVYDAGATPDGTPYFRPR